MKNIAPQKAMTPKDRTFLEQSITIVERHLLDLNFNVQYFANQVGLSRTHMHRKMRELLNQNCSEFIRNTRLEHAAIMLKTETVSINEIALRVGFGDPGYFTKCFKKQFGCLPSVYRKL